METALKRIRYADPLADITVNYQDESMTLERYDELKAPILYRLIYSDSDKYGELVAMDIYEKGEALDVMVFDSLYKVADFIRERQQDDEYYYIARAKYLNDHEALAPLGLYEYELNDKEKSYQRLRTTLNNIRKQQRESAGDTDDIE